LYQSDIAEPIAGPGELGHVISQHAEARFALALAQPFGDFDHRAHGASQRTSLGGQRLEETDKLRIVLITWRWGMLSAKSVAKPMLSALSSVTTGTLPAPRELHLTLTRYYTVLKVGYVACDTLGNNLFWAMLEVRTGR
jgi:hypothetical protein